MRRFAFSFLLAAICAAVLSARVYVDFERLRVRVVTTPVLAADDTLHVPLPDLTHLAASRSALVFRFRGAPDPADIVVTLDGRRVTRLDVPANREVRIDAAAPLPRGEGHTLTLTSDRPGWALTYLEIANVHGYSRGLVDLVILPHERTEGTRFDLRVFVPVLIGLLALRPRAWWPRRRHRWMYWAAASLVLLLFASALLAETFTRYRILLSLQTVLLGAAILYAEPIARLRGPAEPHVRRAWPHITAGVRRWGPLLPYVLLPMLLLWCVGQFYERTVGFTPLIRFGEQFSPTVHPTLARTAHAVEPGSGYDGQFYAQLMFDPLLRGEAIVPALDSPGYRARRILFPWAAYLIGFGHPWYALQAYALLNVASWLVLAWLLVRWLPPGSARPTCAWAACLFAEGMLASIRQSLVDGPSMLLLALSVAAVERNRRWLAAGILGLAGLGRDTNVLGGFVLGDGVRDVRRLLATAAQGLLVLGPLLVWMAYLSRVSVSPGETGSSNFALPFVAFAHKWSVTLDEIRLHGWGSFARFSLLSVVALTTQLAVLVYLRDWRNAWWRMGIAYAGLMLVVGEAVWYGYPGATARVVLPMTFAFNILLPRTHWFWPLWVAGNANILIGLSALRVPWIWELI